MTTQQAQTWQFWIDRGGTFTDVVARLPDGTLQCHKLLSDNPENYPDAAVQGVRDLLKLGPDEPIPSKRIDTIKMGIEPLSIIAIYQKSALIFLPKLRLKNTIGYILKAAIQHSYQAC